MRKRIAIKDHVHEIQLINRRAIAALVLMVILVLLLITRLAYLQFTQHDLYSTLSKKNWLDLVPLEPMRGLIYDRNGIILAENIPVFSLDIMPNKIKNLQQTLADVAKIVPLTDTDISQFHKQLKQHRRFEEIPLKMRLSEAEVAKLSENLYRFPGATIKARLIRHYPYSGTLSHVLGYVGRINTQELNEIDSINYSGTNYIGKLGIEKYYEEELHGKVGYEQAENDARGEPLRVINSIKPTAGQSIYLTIDINLQLAVEQALGRLRGAVVVVQPNTGQILALVSEPTYDPNMFVAGVSNQDFQALQQSPDRPLYNRALRGAYPLASTIKPYLGLQGLKTGTVSPQYTIRDPGWFRISSNSDRIFRDWRHLGHGNVNLKRAIVVSCDTYFYDLAYKMGIKNISEVLTDFGFGELSGLDIGEEIPGNVATPEWKKRVKGVAWYPGDTVNSGIGQGFMQATPLQLAVAAATMANRGQRFTPYLMLGYQEPAKPYFQQAPVPLNKVNANAEVWKTVIDGMLGVVNSKEGTAYTRLGQGIVYTVAGKTGTAQVRAKKHTPNEGDHEDQSGMPEHLRDHSLFIAFAPVDKPQIAIAVVVENSLMAVNVAKKILDYYILHKPVLPLPIPPDKKITGNNANDIQRSVKTSL